MSLARTLALLQRIDFPDDSEHPVEGAWRHRFEFEHCCETKIYHAIFVAKERTETGGVAVCAGRDAASPILVRDAMMAALVTVVASLPTGTNVNGFKDVSFVDMTVTQEPQNLTNGVGRDPWKERWTFSVCGNSASSVITFVPDGRRGRVSRRRRGNEGSVRAGRWEAG